MTAANETNNFFSRTHARRPSPILDRPQLWLGGVTTYASPPHFRFCAMLAALSITSACLKRAYLDRFDAFLLRASGNTEFAVTLCISGAVIAALVTVGFRNFTAQI